MASGVINLLRLEERKARLRFWDTLARMSGAADIHCPFGMEAPAGAIHVGVMPKYMRGAFMRAYSLRTLERKSEAEVYEEAIHDLLQEHFKKILLKHGAARVSNFLLAKDWKVYIVPIK